MPDQISPWKWRRALIFGEPCSQGSKRIGRTGGRICRTCGKHTGTPILVDDDARLKRWRGELSDAMRRNAPPEPICTAVRVIITIYQVRPLSHYGTGRNAGRLKESAPHRPPTGRDVDKVARACLDAGTGVWWVDDSRVAELHVNRFYAESADRERVEVQFGYLLEETAAESLSLALAE